MRWCPLTPSGGVGGAAARLLSERGLNAAKIEAVKNEAVKLQGELQTSINDVKELMKKAPKGKGTDKDLAALKGDLDGAETEFAGIQKAIDAQDYIGALNTAKSIQAKVTGVKDQIQAALDKTKKK